MTNRFISKIVVAATALGLTCAAAAPASAQTEPRSVKVSFADLDLGNSKDRARLDRRIRNAAGYVCGSRYVRELSLAQQIDDCQADAIARANGAVVEVLAARGDSVRVAAN
jgi:UrcA family protein